MKIRLLKNNYLKSFLFSFIIALICFLPYIIIDKGYFFYLGDYNVQQVPFNMLANEAVKSGNIFWNWHTDLGSGFISSYSFYMLGSPFFWLSLLFPASAIPFVLAPLLCLKIGCMGLTSYAFLQRFVKNKDYALIGSLLYAFSGFSVYNIFYNHFHDVMVFFPLILVALEEAMLNGRRGFFAITIAIAATVNYFFFVGEVVFVIIYFLIRYATSNDYKLNLKKFLSLGFEAVVGLGISAFILLPTALTVINNPRVGYHSIGLNFWLYSNEQRIPAILQSFFFPPEIPPFPAFFFDANIRWVSVAGWIPLFSMVCVLAYIKAKKNDWVKGIILTSFVFALVPGLNSAFYMFNNSYYGRWFYMLTLIMSLATIKALEDKEIDYSFGFKATSIVTALYIIIIGFMPKETSDGIVIGLFKRNYMASFIINSAMAVICLALTFILLYKWRQKENFSKLALVITCAVCVVYPMTHIAMSRTTSERKTDYIVERGIEAKGTFTLPDENPDEFYRVDVLKGMDNQAMFWGMPNIQAFHSAVSPSIMEFYPKVGVKRDVSSKPDENHYGLRSLLSVKYLFARNDDKVQSEPTMPGFEYISSQNGYDVYKNKNYVPMGFAYEYCISNENLEQFTENVRDRLLLHAVCLSDEDIEKHSDIVMSLDDGMVPVLSEEQFVIDANLKAQNSCYYFKTENYGFDAKISLATEKIVFFSVPYDEGWSATINGEPAEIIKANIGFMAVRVPSGDNEIRFNFIPKGFYEGIAITIICILLLLAYILILRPFDKRAKTRATQKLENISNDVLVDTTSIERQDILDE
ncbi:MAG: YfhO family protein [Oscillospiraceae bacterium]|nr:YfhO family protein [Oscillospiraceae bacterium]